MDLHKVSLASLAMDLSFAARALCHTDSTDSTDFLHRCARRADAGFLIRLLAALTKSRKSCRFFPFGDCPGTGRPKSGKSF